MHFHCYKDKRQNGKGSTSSRAHPLEEETGTCRFEAGVRLPGPESVGPPQPDPHSRDVRWALPLKLEGGRVLLIEILSARIARQRIAYKFKNIKTTTRKTRIDQSELDESFQPYHLPFR